MPTHRSPILDAGGRDATAAKGCVAIVLLVLPATALAGVNTCTYPVVAGEEPLNALVVLGLLS